jgi:L-lactate permease
MYNFAFGFIVGSLFNLFVIWCSNKFFLPKNNNNDTSNKKILKEIEEQLHQQKEQTLKEFSKDLSLTIKNLYINPQEKEHKNVVNQNKETNNHVSLMHHDLQEIK